MITACRKDSDITKVIDTQDPIPKINVESSVTGSVTNTQGSAVQQAKIEINGSVLETNDKGHYFLNEKLLNANGNYVKASKSGHFSTGKFTQAHLGTSDNLDIQMIPKQLTQTIDPSITNKISFSGCSVQFQANSLVDANGKLVADKVRVYTTYLNPVEETSWNKIPGDGRVVTKNGGAAFMKLYGIVGVELENSQGEKVFLDKNKPAELSVAVSGNNYPTTANFSFFDENTGMWIEEGECGKRAGQFVAEVSHFTFWSVGSSSKFSKLSGQVVDQLNAPISNLKVFVYSSTQGFASDQTNSNGQFDGLVPNDEPLQLVIRDNCGQIVHEQALGKIGGDLDLKTISVKISNQVKITGMLLDCNAAPMKSGIVYISDLSGNTLTTQKCDNKGQFTATLSNCKASKVLVTAYDYGKPLTSNPITVDLNGNEIALGTLLVCNQIDEYVYLFYDGDTRFISGEFEHSYDKSPIEIVYNDLNTPFFMSFNPTGAGLADMQRLGFQMSFGAQLLSVNCNFCTGCDCNTSDKLKITHLAKPSEYTTGNLTGTYKNGLGEVKPYRIDFKVKRDN